MSGKVILAGGNGFIGRLLAPRFLANGCDVVVLTRSASARRDAAREVVWDAKTCGDWSRELEGASAVINLVGRSVNCRYTEANRREILNSRVDSTRVLGEVIARCANPPKAWLNSSTATVYRHTLGPAHDEGSTDYTATPDVKDEFSVQVGLCWEQALAEAVTPHTRKVALRTSLVFGAGQGGVFRVLRNLTRLGLAGRMGDGRQFVSWIHEEDCCRAIEWILDHDELIGPVNLAAPHPLPNAEMMREFRRVCRAPFGLPAARWMLELGAVFLGTETELILKSRRVVPGRLLRAGFQFQFPSMPAALKELEGRMRTTAKFPL
jgi:uncharacterized protein (TIGR01777 family)